MSVADFMAGLDRLEDGACLAYDWACGKADLDGWQLEYAGDCYNIRRIPRMTLRRHLVSCRSGEQGAFYIACTIPTSTEEKARIARYTHRLRRTILEAGQWTE